MDVSGSVADIERVLHVTMQVYQHPTEARMFYAPDVDPSLDLTVPILGISGLNNYSLPRPHYTIKPLINGQAVSSSVGSGPGNTYMGKDFRTAYVPDTPLTGSGQTVGLLQFDGYTASDITYYESLAGLPSVTLTNVLIDGASGNPSGSGGEVEVSLDIEMAISMAPGLSRVIVYEAPNPSPFVDLLNRMATDNLAKQLSCSWYIPNGPAEPMADQIWQQMAAQGQSFFNASGDNDAYTGLISFPGDSTNITQVGGTTLTTSGAGGAWAAETVWNWGNGIGSGGGISTQYPIPGWQTNINMTANQGSTTMRNTPDVALTADNVYVRADGANYNIGGTSCAAPLWAGFTALVNQQATATGEPAVGFINPAFYAIGSGPNYTTCFHDIRSGNNTSGSSPNKFYAVSGYDLCTGWGTPNGQKLINALANPEALQITPATGFTSLGGVGGPFTVSAQNFSLTNVGTNGLTWSLSNTSLWLNASASGGTLTRGGPATNVTLSLNSISSNLLVGTYNATVWLTNLNDHVGQGRQFTLAVLSPPTITAQPTNQAVLDGAAASFMVGVTGGLPLYYQWQYNSNNLSDGGSISGSTTTNLTASNVSAASVGYYNVIVSNVAGVAISSNALLTITASKPVITQQPSNQTAVVGTTAQFTVAAIGTKPFFYQWDFNQTKITNATNATLTLSNAQLSQAGTYAVVVSNALGSTTSSNAILTVTPCDPPPSGLVGWWPAEGNANDIVGGNNGVLENGTGFTNGEVGMAFNLNGLNNFVLVNPVSSTNLDVGEGNGFTIEGWINPTILSQTMVITEYESALGTSSGNDVGLDFSINSAGSGGLNANIKDNGQGNHPFNSPLGLITAGVWQHVAITYDRTSGIADFYLNGAIVTQTNLGSFTPLTSFTNILFGARTTFSSVANPIDVFSGGLDEMSMYSRALSQAEIQAIYLAGSAGKCSTPTPPVITIQPTNQTVAVGQTATFGVTASGTPPLSYQWMFNTTNIAGATNNTFTLTNVQFNQAGNYTVLVSNLISSVLSTNATLTVVPIPPCDPAPSGLVSWWRAEGDAQDAVGSNNGVLENRAGFAAGEVGQAFNFDGINQYVLVTSSNLNVGLGSGLTIEGWINPTSVANPSPLAEYERVLGSFNSGDLGVQFYVSAQSPGNVCANVVESGGGQHLFSSGPNVVSAGTWQHMALTYDKTSGLAIIYVNGAAVLQINLGSFTPQTSFTNLLLGARTLYGSVSSPSDKFTGQMDEMSLYNRALSSNEIATIYLTGSGGKCFTPTPPVITTQPTNQTVVVGQTATFSVSASGTSPLSYQWVFNTTNIAGATNNTLTLTNVQFSQAGTYAVVVSNLANAALSSNATLTVNPPPPCDPAPAGLVSWWRAEGNALDSIDTNNGVLNGGIGFAPGEVGQAFLFTNASAYVDIPASPTLNVGAGSGLTIETWINPYDVSIQHPLTEWVGTSPNIPGVLFWISVSGYGGGPGCLFANLVDTSGGSHIISSPPGIAQANVFQHVALTYDKTTGSAVLYYNGAAVATANLGSLTLQTTTDLALGRRISDGEFYSGLLDEISLYNRALSSNEIAAIYLAGSAGKCFTPDPPVITTQPTNQTVVVGQTATFSVSASGTPPLSYQWTFDTTNIADATNTLLILPNVQPDQVGTYAVVVSNLANAVLSSNATLTVLIPAAIITQPTNQTVYVGSTASFSITASGTLPLSYKWNFNQTNLLAGKTNLSLVLTNVQLNQAGSYAVMVSNLVNSVPSSNAVLTVNSPPALGTAQSGGFLLMFWPANAPGFVLESTFSLALADWVPVSNPPIQIGSEYLESIQMTGTNQFYRLRFTGP